MKEKCDHCPIAGACRATARVCKAIEADPEANARFIAGHVDPRPESQAMPEKAPGRLQERSTASVDGSVVEYPSFAAQTVSVLKAAARFVGDGMARVDQAEYDRRRAICEACPLFDAVKERCRACGCRLNLKPWMRSEHCPKEKW